MSGESAAKRVAGSLRERLLTGDIKPGTRLSQSKLAEAYGVSRIPVRDALQALAGEGLLDLSGAAAVARGLSIAELQELYELREVIEPRLTRIAVPNVGRAEVTTMAALAERMESDISPAEWLAANARFHALVYTKGARPMMIQLTQQLRRLTDRYIYLHIGVFGTMDHLHAEHRRILAAVSAGDAGAAAELTREHIATSHEFILRYLLEHEIAPAEDR